MSFANGDDYGPRRVYCIVCTLEGSKYGSAESSKKKKKEIGTIYLHPVGDDAQSKSNPSPYVLSWKG